MKKYIYESFCRDNQYDLEDKANEMGAEGWRMVSFSLADNDSGCVFMEKVFEPKMKNEKS